MKDGKPDAPKKYSVSIIIPKNDPELPEIQAAIEAAKKAGLTAKFGGKYPPNMKMPLRDGDVERADHPEYANSFFLSASSSRQPGMVDSKVKPITKQDEMYSGVWANINVNFYPFNEGGGKGVACGLNHIQKYKDDEALGNITRAEDVFTAEDENDDDLLGG